MNDWRLLRQYVEEGSEEAFTFLAGRYLNQVYSTCLRETHDPQMAEDATQAVFLLLSRKASKLRREVILTGWLFQAARLISKNALRAERRRRAAEQRAVTEMLRDAERHKQERPEYDGWAGIEPCLNDALDALGARDRDAVLLRFFEDRSLAEVGAALGITEDAARMRVARALEKMQRFLVKLGAAMPTAGLGILLTTRATHAAPPACAAALPQIAAGTMAGPAAHLAVSAAKAVSTSAKARGLAGALTVTLAALLIIGMFGHLSDWLANRVPTPRSSPLPDVAAERKKAQQTQAMMLALIHQQQVLIAAQLRPQQQRQREYIARMSPQQKAQYRKMQRVMANRYQSNQQRNMAWFDQMIRRSSATSREAKDDIQVAHAMSQLVSQAGDPQISVVTDTQHERKPRNKAGQQVR